MADLREDLWFFVNGKEVSAQKPGATISLASFLRNKCELIRSSYGGSCEPVFAAHCNGSYLGGTALSRGSICLYWAGRRRSIANLERKSTKAHAKGCRGGSSRSIPILVSWDRFFELKEDDRSPIWRENQQKRTQKDAEEALHDLAHDLFHVRAEVVIDLTRTKEIDPKIESVPSSSILCRFVLAYCA
uniref:ADF-H domain-containing protein n=1 Tax=Steinernema glaseri TaxID=37863 RepID=A0A1I8ATQ2_9BILA